MSAFLITFLVVVTVLIVGTVTNWVRYGWEVAEDNMLSASILIVIYCAIVKFGPGLGLLY